MVLYSYLIKLLHTKGPQTAVSMTLRDVLLDSAIFEDPETFRPERWLSSNPELQYLNEFYVPFGRGSRMCIGIKYVDCSLTLYGLTFILLTLWYTLTL